MQRHFTPDYLNMAAIGSYQALFIRGRRRRTAKLVQTYYSAVCQKGKQKFSPAVVIARLCLSCCMLTSLIRQSTRARRERLRARCWCECTQSCPEFTQTLFRAHLCHCCQSVVLFITSMNCTPRAVARSHVRQRILTLARSLFADLTARHHASVCQFS